MKLLTWTDVLLVVKTIVEGYDLSDITIEDKYRIEKLTDSVFTDVRNKQLADEDFNLKGREQK